MPLTIRAYTCLVKLWPFEKKCTHIKQKYQKKYCNSLEFICLFVMQYLLITVYIVNLYH